MKRLKVGIIGAGNVAFAHVNGFRSHNEVELVALCRRNREKLRDVGKKWNIKSLYTDYHDLLKDRNINIVAITVPTYLHAEIAIAAAQAGKHILLEKPMCRSLREADEIITAAEESNIKLMVAESYAFITSHMMAKKLIEAGEIGKSMQIELTKGRWVPRKPWRFNRKPGEIHWRVDPQKSGGGEYPFEFDHMCHFFATARYLMENTDIKRVFALSKDFVQIIGGKALKVKNIPAVVWQYIQGDKQGLWMRADESTKSFDYLGFRTIIRGTEGLIEVLGEGGGPATSGQKVPPLILHKKGRTTYFKIDEPPDRIWISEINYYDQAHTNEILHFVDSILEDKKSPYPGEEGKKNIQCTLGAIKSAKEGVPVELKDIPIDYTAY